MSTSTTPPFVSEVVPVPSPRHRSVPQDQRIRGGGEAQPRQILNADLNVARNIPQNAGPIISSPTPEPVVVEDVIDLSDDDEHHAAGAGINNSSQVTSTDDPSGNLSSDTSSDLSGSSSGTVVQAIGQKKLTTPACVVVEVGEKLGTRSALLKDTVAEHEESDSSMDESEDMNQTVIKVSRKSPLSDVEDEIPAKRPRYIFNIAEGSDDLTMAPSSSGTLPTSRQECTATSPMDEVVAGPSGNLHHLKSEGVYTEDLNLESRSTSEIRQESNKQNKAATDDNEVRAPTLEKLPSVSGSNAEPGTTDSQASSTASGGLPPTIPELSEKQCYKARIDELIQERNFFNNTEVGRKLKALDQKVKLIRKCSKDGSIVIIGPSSLTALIQNHLEEEHEFDGHVVVKSSDGLKYMMEQYLKDGKDSPYKYFVYMFDADADFDKGKEDFIENLALLTANIKEKSRLDVFYCRSVKNREFNFPSLHIQSIIQAHYAIMMQTLHYDHKESLDDACEYSINRFYASVNLS